MKHIENTFTSQNDMMDPFRLLGHQVSSIEFVNVRLVAPTFAKKQKGDGMGDATILRLVRLLRLARMTRVAKLLRAFPEVLIMIKGLLPLGPKVWGRMQPGDMM